MHVFYSVFENTILYIHFSHRSSANNYHYSCKEEQEDLAWILTLTTCVFLNIQDQELKLNYQDYAQSGCVNVYN